MDIRNTERHERIVAAFLTVAELEALVRSAVSERTGISLETLRKNGKVEIEPNMEGSPSYQRGHRATFRATIPIAEPADAAA